MSPDPLVRATWTSDDGASSIVLYDHGVVKMFSGEFETVLADPWKTSSPPPESPPPSSGEKESP